MVALAPRDEVAPFRLADLDEVLARQLERGLDRLGAARDEIDVRHALGRARDQVVGELFRDLGGEKARVRVGDAVDLLVHRAQDVGVTVAEAGHRGAAGGVDVRLAVAVDDLDAASGDRDRQRPPQLAVQDMRQGLLLLPTNS